MAGAGQSSIGRAIVATLALYALVVSGFVAGLRPVSAMPAELGIACTHEGRQDAPAPDRADHALCCTLVCAAAAHNVATVPPEGLATRPERAATSLHWKASQASPDTARFLLSLRARGPPAV